MQDKSKQPHGNVT